jgi:hypothetical protein
MQMGEETKYRGAQSQNKLPIWLIQCNKVLPVTSKNNYQTQGE